MPRDERLPWTARALWRLETSPFEHRVEFLVGIRDTKRLARVIADASNADLIAAGFLHLDPAARQLRRSHPAAAARAEVGIALDSMRWGTGGRFLALIPLRRARALYRRCGMSAEWDSTVRELLLLHPRARKFQAGLRAVHEGKPEDPALEDWRARRSLWDRWQRP